MDLLSVNVNFVVNGWTIELAYTDDDEIQCMRFVANTWPEVMELLTEHIEVNVVAEEKSYATVYDMDAARAVRALEEELPNAGDMILEMNDHLNGIDYDEEH